MYIILGILASLLVMVLEYFSGYGYNLFSINSPTHAFFTGACIGGIIGIGIFLTNRKVKKTDFIVCIIIGLITFIGVNYMEYKSTYVMPNSNGTYTVNRGFHGEPISGFVANRNGQAIKMNFFNYEKYCLDESKSIITNSIGQQTIADTRGATNYVMFFLNIILMLIAIQIGTLVCLVIDYCDVCKKYYSSKTIFYANEMDIFKILSEGKIKIEDISDFSEFVKNHKKKIKKGIVFVGTIIYCKKCKDAKLTINKYIYKGGKKRRYNTSYNMKMENNILDVVM